MQGSWQVYLAGEIHSNWRDDISRLCRERNLPIQFVSPNTDHAASDECGAVALGPEDKRFWYDFKSARLNQARNRVLLERSDVVVVRFGEQYRQWNSAFDAGYAVAHGKSLISWHDSSLDHALKEIDAAASAVAKEVEQVVKSLAYITSGYVD